MIITKTLHGTELTIAPEGRLDTTTAPDLEKVLEESMDGVTALTLDFGKLEFISSAGLRLLLAVYKTMNARGGDMKLTNVNETVSEVFELTGFGDILNIE